MAKAVAERATTKGEGRPAPARTCCPTHADNCIFGRQHLWAGPFLLDGGRPVDGQIWSHPDDVFCVYCKGTCSGDREEQPGVSKPGDAAEGPAPRVVHVG